jgi:PPE-repeat protein
MATDGTVSLMLGNRWYGGSGLLGGSEQQTSSTVGGVISGEAVATAAPRVRIYGPSLLATGNANTVLNYAGLPTTLTAVPQPLVGNAVALLMPEQVDVPAAGSLVVFTSPDKATTERAQYGRAGKIVES